MKNVKNDPGYKEGIWSGKTMIKYIERTEYGNLKTAIAVKEKLINHFETEFGYSREMDVEKFDFNYANNVGILDTLKEAYGRETS